MTYCYNHLNEVCNNTNCFTHILLDFGDLDKSFSLGNAHASMALRSLNHDFIVHEALVLVLRLVG